MPAFCKACVISSFRSSPNELGRIPGSHNHSIVIFSCWPWSVCMSLSLSRAAFSRAMLLPNHLEFHQPLIKCSDASGKRALFCQRILHLKHDNQAKDAVILFSLLAHSKTVCHASAENAGRAAFCRGSQHSHLTQRLNMPCEPQLPASKRFPRLSARPRPRRKDHGSRRVLRESPLDLFFQRRE